MEIQKVMDREKIAATIHAALDLGADLFGKDKLEQQDFAKLKALRGLASYVNAATTMVQQETAQQRAAIVIERMKQLGYDTPAQLK